MLSHGDGWETSEARISKALGVGRYAVNSAIKKLIEHGFVERSQLLSEGNQFRSMEYIVHDCPITSEDRDAIPRDAVSRLRETKPLRRTITKKTCKQEDENTNARILFENSPEDFKPAAVEKIGNAVEPFDAFWVDYGRKGNKAKAAKFFKQLSTRDQVLAHSAISLYELDMPDRKYRLDAERYLRDRRFENYTGQTEEEVLALSHEPVTLTLSKNQQRIIETDAAISEGMELLNRRAPGLETGR